MDTAFSTVLSLSCWRRVQIVLMYSNEFSWLNNKSISLLTTVWPVLPAAGGGPPETSPLRRSNHALPRKALH